MTALAISLLVVFAFCAAFTQRVSGFGFGIFIMTILPHIMPSYGEATALSGMLSVLTAVFTAVSMRRFLPWRKLLPIMLTFLVVSFFAVRCVTMLDSHLFRKILGGVLVLVSIYFLFVAGHFSMKPTVGVQIGMGTISGVMGGLFAIQGPPAVIYFIGCAESKEEYTALTQWFFLIGNTMMTLFRAGNGLVTAVVGKSFLIAAGAVLLGLFVGSKVYDRINLPLLRRIVYIYMAVAGVIAIIF